STSSRRSPCSIAQQWIGSGSDQGPGTKRSSWRRTPSLGNRNERLTRTLPVWSAWIRTASPTLAAGRNSHPPPARLRLGGADDQRAHPRWRLVQPVVGDLRHVEARRLHALERVAVAVAAASDDAVHGVDAVLPARRPRRVGAHVLDEQQ